VGTFLQRIEGYIGTLSDTNSLQNWLDAGVALVVEASKPDKLKKLIRDVTVESAGLSVAGLKILGAHKANIGAREAPYTLKAKLEDTASIYKATATDPAYCIGNGKIFVIPGGGTAITVTYPTVTSASSDITEFEANQEQGVVLYAAIQGLNHKAQLAITANDALTVTVEDIPTAPSLSDLELALVPTSYTSASVADAITSSGTYTPIVAVGDLTPPTISASVITTLTSPPTYTKDTTTFDFTDADARLANDDSELTQAELMRVQTELATINKAIQDELNEFSKDSVIFQGELQKAVHNSNQALQASIEQSQATLNANIQNLRKDLEIAVADARNALETELFNTGKSVDVELANLRKDMEVELQNKIKTLESDFFDSKNALEAASLNNEFALKQFAAEVQAYSAKVMANIQAFQGRIQNKSLTIQSYIGLGQSLREELKLILETL